MKAAKPTDALSKLLEARRAAQVRRIHMLLFSSVHGLEGRGGRGSWSRGQEHGRLDFVLPSGVA